LIYLYLLFYLILTTAILVSYEYVTITVAYGDVDHKKDKWEWISKKVIFLMENKINKCDPLFLIDQVLTCSLYKLFSHDLLFLDTFLNY